MSAILGCISIEVDIHIWYCFYLKGIVKKFEAEKLLIAGTIEFNSKTLESKSLSRYF